MEKKSMVEQIEMMMNDDDGISQNHSRSIPEHKMKQTNTKNNNVQI